MTEQNKKPVKPPTDEINLSIVHWLIVLVAIALLFWLTPKAFERIEKFNPGNDYRIPYSLSNDYWIYNRYCRHAVSRYDNLVIGDSVIWGHYVSPDQNLPHHLNKIAQNQTFANMGIDGIHPAALLGLIKHYSRSIENKKIVLSFNPLWMTSKKHDLQTNKEFRFNHPQLVPQFIPKIPCYTNSTSDKIGAVLKRNSDFLSWTSHIKTTYFDNMDLSTWSLELPYKCPLKNVTLRLPQPKNNIASVKPWNANSPTKQNFPWVQLETSLQWAFFKQSIQTLQDRNNTVFVIIGPFNEHMMTEQSLQSYSQIKTGIQQWLQTNNVPHYIPRPLAPEHYADASHPLQKGYAILAKELYNNTSFKSKILQSP